MNEISEFQYIYFTAIGQLIPEARVPWVKDITGKGTVYSQCYKEFWEAREHLCERFDLEWEDADLELIMDGIMHVEEAVGRAMFENGIEYAKRGCKLE